MPVADGLYWLTYPDGRRIVAQRDHGVWLVAGWVGQRCDADVRRRFGTRITPITIAS